MKNLLRTLLIVTLSVGFFSCNKLDPDKVRVEGTVARVIGAGGGALNAEVVSGASVAFYPAGNLLRDRIGSATTGSDGKFSFDIAPGDYDIVATKTGTSPGSATKSNVTIPESKKGMTYDIGEFLF